MLNGTRGIRSTLKRGLVAGLLAAFAALAIGTQRARAVFPGANGRIAFTVQKFILQPAERCGSRTGRAVAQFPPRLV